MRATKLRTSALLAAATAVSALSAIVGAPAAAADQTIDCQPGQIVINSQCNVPSMDPNNNAPRNSNNASTGAVGGTGGGSGAGHGR